MSALLLAALAAVPHGDTAVVVKLGDLNLKEAEALDGRPVVAAFTVGQPPFTWGEGDDLRTVVGPAGRGAGNVERTAVLKGDRLHDADLDARLTVVGTLRVIRHPASTINGKPFAGFTEIRLVER
jgi:hypothetical protein